MRRDNTIEKHGRARMAARRPAAAVLWISMFAGCVHAQELPLDRVEPRGHPGDIVAVVYSDGATLVTAGTDGLAKLWDVATGNVRADLAGHKGKVVCLAVSPDGKTVATGGEDRTVKLWNTRDGSSLSTLEGHSAAVTALAFAPDGKTLASGSVDTKIRIWDVAGRRTSRARRARVSR